MTAFLASVRNASEASVALGAGADIIDAKEPDAGALGAVSLAELARIVAEVNGARAVSATVGDLPMNQQLIADAVRERAECGATYVKFGFFDSLGALQCAEASHHAASHAKIIAVFFADLAITRSFMSPDYLASLAGVGVSGVMLDTADKSGGGLLRHLPIAELRKFVHDARTANLSCGLAGALQIHDIHGLAELQPDFLGFRGALCASGVRGQALDSDCVARIAGMINGAKAS